MPNISLAAIDSFQDALLLTDFEFEVTIAMSLHAADPGQDGSNEGTDGRQPITFAASSGGIQVSSDAVTWTLGGETPAYYYFGLWLTIAEEEETIYARGGMLTPPVLGITPGMVLTYPIGSLVLSGLGSVFTQQTEGTLLAASFGADRGPITADSTYYMGLHYGPPGVDGENEGTEGRQAIIFEGLSFTDGLVANTEAITWSDLTGEYPYYYYFGIWSAAEDGDYIWGGEIIPPLTGLTEGASFTFPAGTVSLLAS